MTVSQFFFRPDLRATIDSQRLLSNISSLKSALKSNTKFCAVIKANAYGHGVLEVVNILKDESIDFYAVASIYEALYILPVAGHRPILVFEPLSEAIERDYISLASHSGIHCALCSQDGARYAADALTESDRPLKVHINVETGMGRLGIEPLGAFELINYVDSSPRLELAGIYTHFATADEDDLAFAYEQLDNFNNFLERSGINKRHGVIRHAANSAATLKLPGAHFDMVRCGISMYGYYSRSQKKPEFELKPVMKVEAPIVHIKKIPIGRSVSYGRSYFTHRDTLSAIIPLGYSDGYSRTNSNVSKVRIGNHFAPVIGRVCMDQVMVDVTDVPGVYVGQYAVIIDNEHNSPAGAYALADAANTICYEILITVNRHVNRIVL
ncbi:MAG: alanine racemase [Phycisphaerae bacterium]|jgi:alanine racemase